MSSDRAEPATHGPDQYPPICEYCGTFITDPGQRCAALDDGRCCP